MHPDLFSFGPVTVHSYGLMVALGILAAVYLAWRNAPRVGIDREQLLDAVFWLVLAGIIGARIFYVMITWKEFARDPGMVFRIWDGGLVFYGALIFGLLAAVLYSRRTKMPLARFVDLCAPYLALAHAIGRIGCFLSGCCYGCPSSQWGVIFPALGDGVARLPTQLYESGFNFLLFFGLLYLRRCQRVPGQIFWWYVAGYAAGRVVIEFFRGDEIRGTLFFNWLHTSQLIAFLSLAVALGMLFYLKSKPSSEPDAQPPKRR